MSETSRTPEQEQRIARAEAKLAAANLRLSAAQRDQMTAGYLRQMDHPVYDGQEIVCAGKAAVTQGLSDRERAQADLIEAEAGL